MPYISDQKDFEKKVLEVAKLKFPYAQTLNNISIDGVERDGLFIGKDMVNYIECTISKKGDKAKKDINKLDSLKIKLERKYNLPVGLWFITKDKPQPDQVKQAHSSKNQIRILSLNDFISTIFDANNYLRLRDEYNFGSVSFKVDGIESIKKEYIPIKLADIAVSDRLWDSEDIANDLKNGKKFLILGQYGVGKSMTLRDVYYRLRADFISNKVNKFPIYINLRDHDGQTETDEVLFRHAKKIGYSNPHELVQAWLGGFVILILDGYDEISSLGYSNTVSKLKDLRYRSLKIVREFLNQCKQGNGLVLAGRSNYFDRPEELRNLLGVTSNYNVLSIDDFSPDQAREFLSVHEIEYDIPDWIPTKPLLLGYLIAKRILQNINTSTTSPAAGWDIILEEISRREAAIDSGVHPEDIRSIIEMLAAKARLYENELGPITDDDLKKTFLSVIGESPDDKGINILQRLPGLGPQSSDGSRSFIDEDLASAAKAGYVSSYVIDPYNSTRDINIEGWGKVLGTNGIEVLAYLIFVKLNLSKGQWRSSIEQASRSDYDVLAFDIYLAGRTKFRGWESDNLILGGFSVDEFIIDYELNESNVTLRDLYIGDLEIESREHMEYLPKFVECAIENVEGVKNEGQLPIDKFIDCAFNKFERNELTSNYLLSLDIPAPVSVGYSILKKLYMQRGRGRKESALSRGLPHSERQYVSEVLKVLSKNGYAIYSNASNSNIWLPVKGKKQDVVKILSNKSTGDSLSKQLMEI